VDGVDAAVALVSSFNPDPEEELAELLSSVPLAVTVESHFVSGGLGTLVAEVIAEHGLSTTLRRCGVAELPRGLTGSQPFLENRHGISAVAVARTALSAAGSRR
jgi:transketolase